MQQCGDEIVKGKEGKRAKSLSVDPLTTSGARCITRVSRRGEKKTREGKKSALGVQVKRDEMDGSEKGGRRKAEQQPPLLHLVLKPRRNSKLGNSADARRSAAALSERDVVRGEREDRDEKVLGGTRPSSPPLPLAAPRRSSRIAISAYDVLVERRKRNRKRKEKIRCWRLGEKITKQGEAEGGRN